MFVIFTAAAKPHKSAASLSLGSPHQADIRMCSHGLMLRLDDNKSAACMLSKRLMQVDFQDFLSTSLMHVANIKLHHTILN